MIAATDTANAINEVARQMGNVAFGISGVFVVAIYLPRTAARRRFLLWVYYLVIFAVLLWFIPPFMRAGDGAIDIAFMLAAYTGIVWLDLRFTTFCNSCARFITNNKPWRRIPQCPHCGAPLRRPL